MLEIKYYLLHSQITMDDRWSFSTEGRVTSIGYEVLRVLIMGY